MPLTMRADTTEYVSATVTADHDMTAATIEVALPSTDVPPEVWYPAVTTAVVVISNRWQATYRILLGPAGGVTQLAPGTYDWTVRITDNPGPERPIRKAGVVTVTET